MYESPIKLNSTDPIIESVEQSMDNYIVRAVQSVGIEVDKDELGKALMYDRDQYEKGYADGRSESMKNRTDYADAIDSVTWYNGLSEYVDRWKDLPEEGDKYYSHITCPNCYCAEDCPDAVEQLQVIWMIAVKLFGDYGTSPRYGWIEKTDEFRGWVYRITQTWRESLGDKEEVLNDNQTTE